MQNEESVEDEEGESHLEGSQASSSDIPHSYFDLDFMNNRSGRDRAGSLKRFD